jgi:hypothetical protein
MQRFDLVRFPWLVECLDCLADYRVEEQLLIAPTQVGKTSAAEGALCYFVCEDPGDLTAYTHTIELVRMWAKQRVIPALERCRPAAAFLPHRAARTFTEIIMPHMVLELEPANLSSTQSRTRRIVICDERWQWEAGRYDNAKRRASAPIFEGRRKIASFSNAGDYESDMELQWRLSDQRVIAAACPKCGVEGIPFKFSAKKSRRISEKIPGFTVVWDENPQTRPDGVWDIDAVLETVRLRCPHCDARLEDTPRTRLELRRSMKYVALNPRASVKSRAWAVSGVAVYPWADLVRQFIHATMQMDLGSTAEMREFILKGLNEPWSEEVIFDASTNSTGDYETRRERWEIATTSAMTVDVQAWNPHFWFVIRDWVGDGRSRLRLCGTAQTWDELRAIQQEHGIVDNFVHVDSGYTPSEVYEHCARFGWIALRGTDEEAFIHSRGLPRPVRRFFSEPRSVDPSVGTDQSQNPALARFRRRAVEVSWSNAAVKDILARLYGGKGVYYGIPSDVPQFYLDQMASEKKSVVETRGTREIRRWTRIGKRPNHLWDCEAMQIVFALISGPLRSAATAGQDAD